MTWWTICCARSEKFGFDIFDYVDKLTRAGFRTECLTIIKGYRPHYRMPDGFYGEVIAKVWLDTMEDLQRVSEVVGHSIMLHNPRGWDNCQETTFSEKWRLMIYDDFIE